MGLADNYPNLLKIRIPPSPRQVVGMADPITVDRAFITYVAALCHEGDLLEKIDKKYSTVAP